MRVVSPVPRCWHEVSMLRMHGFATPVKPRWRRWCSFCQKNLNRRMSGRWSSPGGSSHLILRGEVQSGHELQLLWGKSNDFCSRFEDQLYVPHSLKPRSEVCQERQQGREGDAFFWCRSFFSSRFFKSSPMSSFFCHSCLTLFLTLQRYSKRISSNNFFT